MKKNFAVAASMVALVGVLSLSGCGGVSSDAGDQPGKAQIKNRKAGKSDSIKLEDIELTVEEGFWHDERKPVFTYTNNSDFDIIAVDVEFSQKEDVTDEQRATVFAEFMEDEFYKDDDFAEYTIDAAKEQLVERGETSSEAAIYLNNTGRMFEDASYYELFEPSMIQVMYLGGDGKIYLEYIDFLTGKTKDASQGGKDAQMWSDSDLGKRMPKLEAPVRIVTTDDEEDLWFEAMGLTIDDYNAYVDQLKEAGYDQIDYEDDDEFRAHDKDGYEASATFIELSGKVNAHLDTSDVKAAGDEATDEDATDQQVSADFKKSVDEYELFFDEYVKFMRTYQEADSPADMMAEYSDYMTQYADTMEALDAMDPDNLSAADAAYLLEAQARITGKIASI